MLSRILLKLRQLFSDLQPAAGKSAISLSIGEPRHASPPFVIQTIADNLQRLANYPNSAGLPELRSSIRQWLQRRFTLASVDPDSQVIPVNGTRERCLRLRRRWWLPAGALVMSPNPFYQIYEGAALLAGAAAGH